MSPDGRASLADRERQVTQGERRRRLVRAGVFDPEQLSEQAQRILRWLTEWDDWTVDGVAEMLAAAQRSGRNRQSGESRDGGTVTP